MNVNAYADDKLLDCTCLYAVSCPCVLANRLVFCFCMAEMTVKNIMGA